MDNRCGMTKENLSEKEKGFPLKECAGCDDFNDECGTYTCNRMVKILYNN